MQGEDLKHVSGIAQFILSLLTVIWDASATAIGRVSSQGQRGLREARQGLEVVRANVDSHDRKRLQQLLNYTESRV